MIVTDVNLLLYAYDSGSPLHPRAKAWLERQLSGAETVGFAWSVLLAFIRLTTSPRVFEQPLDPTRAIKTVESWLAQPCAIVVEPGPRHLVLLRGFLEELGTGGNLTSDAHLAALAVEHGAELYSADGDFARFAGVRWRNPLA